MINLLGPLTYFEFGNPGALLERGDDTIYFRSVVGGEVTSHDVPPPPPPSPAGS